MKFRIYRCDPRVRGHGFWESDCIKQWEYLVEYKPARGPKTPLHPGAIDQKFAQDPRFHWVPREVFINE